MNSARLLPERKFIIGGNGWTDRVMSQNVKALGHVFTKDHNAFNCTPQMVLNISRASMARYGFSPATRVFEAAGAAACLITDAWEGPYKIVCDDESLTVISYGPDKKEGTADDIHVPEGTPTK